MLRRERGEIFLRQLEQSHCRTQTAAVFWVAGMLKIFLKMNKRPRRLDQSLEKIVVGSVGI